MLNRRIKIICVIVGMLFSALVTSVVVERKKEELQNEIAEEVLRFHVLANSDREEDQILKMEIKEAILSFMKEELPESRNLKETKEWVKANLTEIENIAKMKIRQKGYSYPVKAQMASSYFPDKTYGDITFPAGIYEALRVEIGAADGRNWWCVLYPNLCFLNAVQAVVPEEGKEELEEVLDDEAYDMVTSKTIFRIKWFFF